MALGKQIGQFSMQPTSITWGPGAGSALMAQANMEGIVSGDLGEGLVMLIPSASGFPLLLAARLV